MAKKTGIANKITSTVRNIISTTNSESVSPTRRDFLRKSGVAAGAATVGMSVTSGSVSADEEDCPWPRTDDTHLPFTTNGEYGGWGGANYWGTASGYDNTLIVFVHGNGGQACNFNTIAEDLRQNGYTGDEL